MQNSDWLRKWNLSVKRVVCRTLWQAGLLLPFVALIVCVPSRPMQASRSGAATGIDPAVAQEAITCGDLVSGTITAAGQQVIYTFSGQANEKKTLTLGGSGFPFGVTATATVLSPTAGVLVTFNANDQKQLMLPETGTYVIQIRASNLVSTGSYSLGLECLLPTS